MVVNSTSYEVGQYAEISHRVSELDLVEFARLSGDDNPLHVDPSFAQSVGNKNIVSHGILTASLISRLIGTRLPGNGSLWLSQEMEFVEAVYPGDLLTARVTVVKLYPKDNLMNLKASVTNQKNNVVLRGIGRVRFPNPAPAVDSSDSLLSKSLTRNVLILGASGSLGQEVCKQLSQFPNYKIVALFHNSPDILENLVDKLNKLGSSIRSIGIDVTSNVQVSKMFSQLKDLDLIPDIVISCAALPPENKIVSAMNSKDVIRSMEVELFSLMNIIEFAFPSMKQRNFGRIVSVSSTAAIGKPDAGWASYSISKSAVESYIKSLAVEVGIFGITSNVVASGLTNEGMSKSIPSRIHRMGASETPIGRLTNMFDVAQLIEFLISDRASAINGQTVIIDGGRQM
jgi:3-oxoacyl-[acyl-carrier protein] reductase